MYSEMLICFIYFLQKSFVRYFAVARMPLFEVWGLRRRNVTFLARASGPFACLSGSDILSGAMRFSRIQLLSIRIKS